MFTGANGPARTSRSDRGGRGSRGKRRPADRGHGTERGRAWAISTATRRRRMAAPSNRHPTAQHTIVTQESSFARRWAEPVEKLAGTLNRGTLSINRRPQRPKTGAWMATITIHRGRFRLFQQARPYLRLFKSVSEHRDSRTTSAEKSYRPYLADEGKLSLSGKSDCCSFHHDLCARRSLD